MRGRRHHAERRNGSGLGRWLLSDPETVRVFILLFSVMGYLLYATG